MSAQPMMFSTGRVLVTDGVVYVRELDESDDEVVRIVAESDDPVAAVGQCLRVGARALKAAHVSVDVNLIERSFSELETRFGAKVSDAVDEIARASSGLLDAEDGALAGTLSGFNAELSQLLGDTFDADSKSSVLAHIEQLVLGTMKGLITPEIADSPIGRLKAELVDTMQREVGEIAEEVRRVTDHLGILEATDEVYEQTTGKGFDYEDLVDECVATLAAGYGDLAEVTAKQSGSRASQVGDEVVTLNRDDTHGTEARFVLEMKNRPLNMRKTMAELEEALCNRDALAAIAVFRSQEQAPTVGAVRVLRRQGHRGARPRRRGRVGAAARLHVGAVDGAQGPRGERGGRGRPRAGALPARRRRALAGASHRDQAVPHPGQEEHRPGRRPGPRPGGRGARDPRLARRGAARLSPACLTT